MLHNVKIALGRTMHSGKILAQETQAYKKQKFKRLKQKAATVAPTPISTMTKRMETGPLVL